MSDDEKDQTIQEEDEHGNILIYPAWSKKNALKKARVNGKCRFISEY